MEPEHERWHTDDLDALEKTCWAELGRSALVPHAPLRLPTVSTHDPDLGPTSRTVVLRRCHDRARRLEFHTDLRSDKLTHLRADPRHAWHFYDDAQRLQIRALAVASLHHGDDHVAAAAWSRQLDPEHATHDRANFCVVRAQILRLELLHLAHDRHRRARFTYDGHARSEATWLTP